MLRSLWFGAIACCLASTPAFVSAQLPDAAVPACRAPTAGPVSWVSLAGPDDAAVLRRWCESVGPPVVLQASASARPDTAGAPLPTALVVATWNVHVGRGDVAALRQWIAARHESPGRRTAVVLILQEAVRAGADVPGQLPPGLETPRRIGRGRERLEIVALSEALGLNAVYVPSMRNGSVLDPGRREDRGNAILSTEPLTSVAAIELPFARQRRVAVQASVALAGRTVQLLDVHLDTRGGRARQAEALAAYLAALPPSAGAQLIVGGDLNALRGPRDAAFRALASAAPAVACGAGRTNRWPVAIDVFARWWRGRTDFLFGAPSADFAGATCETVPDYFGSDHRPVVLAIPSDAR